MLKLFQHIKLRSTTKQLLLLVCLFLFISVQAQNAKSMFETANSYYKNKQYEEAEKMYQLIISKEKQNAAVYFNLGNTYYHLKQYANAVLYYEKAKKIHPDDKTIQHNINLTNNILFKQIELSKGFFVTKKIEGFVHRTSSYRWSIYLLISFWLGSILIVIYFFTSNSTSLKIGFITLILAIVFAGFTYSAFKNEHRQDFAIVMQANSSLRKSPVESATTTVAVSAGMKVQILDSDKNWRKVKLPNDKIGWIEVNQITFI
ncbi:MAG: tetratricopeptide repeat protein [Chitinophagales bacterium]|nr:tetratricopeptide repeat protein [Bacteroidota bacterium]